MQRAGDRLQSGPEQTVVHNQEVDPFLGRGCQNARGDVNRRAHFRYPTGIFDL